MSLEYIEDVYYGSEYNIMVLSCDYCGLIEEFTGYWQDCIDQAKRNDWIIFKDTTEYFHVCSKDCLRQLKCKHL